MWKIIRVLTGAALVHATFGLAMPWGAWNKQLLSAAGDEGILAGPFLAYAVMMSTPSPRQGGRGLRPALLLPKMLAVGLLLGSLAGGVVLAAALPQAADANQRRWTLLLLQRLFDWLIIPSSAAAVLFGALLFFQHPRVFWRLRWLRVKLLLVALALPGAHLYLSHQMASQLNDANARGRGLLWGLAAMLAAAILIAVIGRHKPRLGQNWAKDYPR